MPRFFGSSSTVHRYFQQWVELGVFEQLWEEAVLEYDELVGVDWKHQALDSATVKAPLGGEKKRPQSHRPGQTRHQALGTCRR